MLQHVYAMQDFMPYAEGTEMTSDTKIRHVTKPGTNLFLELCFAPAEAKRLQAASRR